MLVKLMNYTPNPDRTCAASARLCYSTDDAMTLMNMPDEKVESLLNLILKNGHLSTLEHVDFTFSIEGVSRSLTHQLVRHRIASYNQRSQRYVDESNFNYITPKSIAENNLAKTKFDSLMLTISDLYKEFKEMGISNDDARSILPNATETKIVVTMNARALLHFFGLRCCNRASDEIHELADKMLVEVKKVAPIIFKNAGPKCLIDNKCNEGKMTCGKLQDVLKKYRTN